MPNYAKFLKDVVAKKRKLGKYETVGLIENCSAIIQNGLPTKQKDPGSFTLSCILGNNVKGRQECPVDTWKTISGHGGGVEGGMIDFYGKEGAEGYEECNVIQVVIDCVDEVEVTYHQTQETLEVCLVNSFTPTNDLIDYGADVYAMVRELDTLPEKIHQRGNNFLPLRTSKEEEQRHKEVKAPRGPPKVELKPLPAHLRYVFLGEDNTYPVVVSAALTEQECDKLVCILSIGLL
ncbi:hypothetical protein AAHA92_09523 [Salvia divinorum]|uniref:Uncharacterized protein n=1 Tax=Salvia divinorum TaxID=28513 RepID=A0ABD1HV85_SALDI